MSGAVSQETQLLMKRLDAIIKVLLETSRPNGEAISVKEKVRILSETGLRPIEIARILGITIDHVSVNIHRLRKTPKSQPMESMIAGENSEQPS